MKYLSSIVFSLSCLLLQAFAFSTAANAQLHFPYQQNERILYYGTTLDSSISYRLSTAYTYTDHRGLASVKQADEELFGYLDTTGNGSLNLYLKKPRFFQKAWLS